jgi:aminopeptidase
MLSAMNNSTLERMADLAVTFAANVQPEQIVVVEAETGMEPLVRATAESAYRAGAKFVEAVYFDPYVKRARLEYADEDSLGFVPSWFGERMLEYGRQRCARIVYVPRVSPGVLAGIDPQRAGRDQMPDLKERLYVINKRQINWTILPYPTEPWAKIIHPEIDDGKALEQLTEELVYVCRLDTDDPAAAWRERMETLEAVAKRLTDLNLDSVHFEGPGTDFTVGLLPSSRWESARMQTQEGIPHMANLPSEEIATTPDPERAEGVVRSTKPLDIGGAIIKGLEVRFEKGRAVSIDADEGAEVLRARAETDDHAKQLGEVALVDREGRIGPLGVTFFNTLLDENAASHIALGNAYEMTVGEEDLDKINKSAIHIDFMIGSNEVQVTGLTRDGKEIPILRDGSWQL